MKTKDIHSHHFGLHLFYIIVRCCNVGIRSRFLWIGASISPFSRVKSFVECFVTWVEMFSGTFVDICLFIVEVHDANLIFWIFIFRLGSLFAISFLRLTLMMIFASGWVAGSESILSIRSTRVAANESTSVGRKQVSRSLTVNLKQSGLFLRMYS